MVEFGLHFRSTTVSFYIFSCVSGGSKSHWLHLVCIRWPSSQLYAKEEWEMNHFQYTLHNC